LIKWRGITVRLHPLFLLLMAVAAAAGLFVELVTLFVIVVIHELGHVAAALHYGWRIREIQLLPFGGVAEVEEAGTIPVRQETVVALAGPLQNAWLALSGWAMGQAGWADRAWSADFAAANVWIGLFNLLPFLPLDGGKLMQAWLSLRLPYHAALRRSILISIAGGAMLAAASAWPVFRGGPVQLNLLVIGIFLIASGWYQWRNIPYLFFRFLVHRSRRSAEKMDAGTIAHPIVVSQGRPLSSVVRLLMKERYHLIYVMNGGRIQQVVPEGAVIEGFLDHFRSR
jgi:stage IV sporulation protein FB